jgi:hypothetical protein
MAEKNNAKCSICGRDYYACLACKDSMSLSPWKSFTDTAEHYKVFQVVRGFSTGVYSKDEARTKLKNIDLSDIDSFRFHIKEIIEDILKEEIVDAIVEKESAIIEEIEKVEEEVSVIQMIAPSRKKKYKVEIE